MVSRQSFGSTIRPTALLGLLTGLLVVIGRAVDRPRGIMSAFGVARLGALAITDRTMVGAD